MSPVKAMVGPPGSKGHGKRSAGEKYVASTPFGTTRVLRLAAGTSSWAIALRRRDEQAVIAPSRRIAIEGGEPPALSSIHPGLRPAGVGRHLAPFLGVHINEIDDAPQGMRGHACEELRHRRRVNEDALDRPAPHQITDPAGERGIAQERDAEGFVARKSRQSAPPGPCRDKAAKWHSPHKARKWSACRQSLGSSTKHPR